MSPLVLSRTGVLRVLTPLFRLKNESMKIHTARVRVVPVDAVNIPTHVLLVHPRKQVLIILKVPSLSLVIRFTLGDTSTPLYMYSFDSVFGNSLSRLNSIRPPVSEPRKFYLRNHPWVQTHHEWYRHRNSPRPLLTHWYARRTPVVPSDKTDLPFFRGPLSLEFWSVYPPTLVSLHLNQP